MMNNPDSYIQIHIQYIVVIPLIKKSLHDPKISNVYVCVCW